MGRDFYHSFGVARRIYDEADKIVGFGLSQLCFDGPEEKLNATDVAQAAIYVTSVAIYETLLELGKVPTPPAYVAGLSLGEYTALHLAGVLTFADGLRVVRARGQLMQAAANAAPSTMIALMGVDEEQARSICDEAAQGDVIVPADRAPEVTQDVVATVCHIADRPLRAGDRVLLRHGTSTVKALVRSLDSTLNLETLVREAGPEALHANDIGQITLRTAAPLPLDDYADHRRTGSFLLIDDADGATLTAGMAGVPLGTAAEG